MDQPTISRIFEEYQEMRKPRMKSVLNLAYQLTRLQAWDGVLMTMIQRFVIPWVGDDRVADYFATLVKGGVRLDYVPLPPHIKGTVEFDDFSPNKPKSSLQVLAETSFVGSKRQSRISAMALALLSCIVVGTSLMLVVAV